MAKKETLVCRPCGTRVVVTDQGAALVQCYDCGMELVPTVKAPKKAPAKKQLPAKAAAKKAAGKKPAAPKTAPKKKK